jgi:LacI family transcriptional regulator
MAKTRHVAVVIDLDIAFRHHHDIFSGIQRYAHQRGGWEYDIEPFVRHLGTAGYDGVIARATTELAKQSAEERVPLVNVWSGSPVKNIPSVFPDFFACGKMVAEHLLQRGFRQFAFQGYVKHLGSTLGLAGFRSVTSAAKCRCTTQHVSQERNASFRNWEKNLARLEKWIGDWKPPLGVFAIQDTLSRCLANVCRRAGLRVPEDVALISLGNEPLICPNPEPSLSSVELGYERLGFEAANLLDGLMDAHSAGKSWPVPSEPVMIAPKELVVRRSTDAYIVDHPQVAAALRYIAEHSHEGIHVDNVATHVGATVRSLERYFRAVLGRTMSEEIGRLRMERAKRLLVESDQQIKHLALECGFENVKHFYKVFHAVEGVSPNKFRRQRK